MNAPTLLPRIAAGAEARDLELDFVAEQLRFLSVDVGIASGYVELANEPGLGYALRSMQARLRSIVDAEARLYKLLRERLRAEAPTVLEQGNQAASLGEDALEAFWRGLSPSQRTIIDPMQGVAWRQTAQRSDGDRAARVETEGAA